ncbi:MAG: hypothetical protein KME17_31060 [Cyanosarcina radialis HA8281-LM2]|nr:hypothetical protein [Cyanosarcina radialis HA8281-LM2]
MNDRTDAREIAIEHRQQEEHLQQAMLSRTAAEIAEGGESSIRQEARKLMVERRQQEEHTQQSMLKRSAAEVGMKEEKE